MKIVIRKKTSTCEDLDEQSRLFDRPAGEVPEDLPQRGDPPPRAPVPRGDINRTVSIYGRRLTKVEKDIDSLAADVVNRIAPRVAKNIRKQQQFNQLVSQELEDLARQIGRPQEIKLKTPDLEVPDLQSTPTKLPKGLSGRQLDRFARSQTLKQQAQQQQVAEKTISEIRVRIENK